MVWQTLDAHEEVHGKKSFQFSFSERPPVCTAEWNSAARLKLTSITVAIRAYAVESLLTPEAAKQRKLCWHAQNWEARTTCWATKCWTGLGVRAEIGRLSVLLERL